MKGVVVGSNEALAAAQFRGCDSDLICSMSHRDHPPPPETTSF